MDAFDQKPPGNDIEVGLEVEDPQSEAEAQRSPETQQELATLASERSERIATKAEGVIKQGDTLLEQSGKGYNATSAEMAEGRERIAVIQAQIRDASRTGQESIGRNVSGDAEVQPSPESELASRALENESGYLTGHKKRTELEQRYNNETTEAEFVLGQIANFAKERGVVPADIPALEGKTFGSEERTLIFEALQKRVEALLLNKEKGSFSQKKYESVLQEAGRYLDLVGLAQTEGDIPKELEAEAVLRMAEENIAALAFQDRVASENLLGDHGIRHLVDHNIIISEKILDQVAARGQKVKAIDRLLVHQIMIDHDMGYAMSPVRDAINRDGIQGQDAGHNLLAAKFVRQRGGDDTDHLGKIFSQEQLAVMHAGILYHDSAKIDVRLGEDSAEARRSNVETAIHIADNTHAFEDKLPELLYAVPDSLKTLRLMKAAGEIEDGASIEALRQQLAEQIQQNPDFSGDDKEALSKAVASLGKKSYQFSVGRICGNKPEIAIDEKGKIIVTVQESAIHQEAVGLFGQQSYDQLRKFVADLTGLDKSQITDEMLDRDEIGNEKFVITLAIKDKRSSERTDYQKRVEALITDVEFQRYIGQDEGFATQEVVLKAVKPENMDLVVDSNSMRKEGDMRPSADIIAEQLSLVRAKRKDLINNYQKDAAK